MKSSLSRWTWLCGGAMALITACGGGTINLGPTPTPTRTPTPTPTHVAGNAVSGLLVVQHAVAAGAGDALGAAPDRWAPAPDAVSFDRALSHADWSVAEAPTQRGVTGPDGAFTIGGLAGGRYTLEVTKTIDGNLASFTVPFSTGAAGGDVVAEMAWGQVKSVSSFSDAGVPVRDIVSPTGTRLVTRDGRVVELDDPNRALTDPDGDGRFQCDLATGDLCPDVTIVSISLNGLSQLIVGQQGSVSATALLSDGTAIDVTFLVDWQVSDDTIARVDSWGTVTALAIGSVTLTATLTAALGPISSSPWPLTVTARPPLLHIYLQNVSCMFPLGAPVDAGGGPPVAAPAPADILPRPTCGQVVQIGATIQFQALGEFADGYYEDITDEVQWQVAPPNVGDVVAGEFTGRQAGTANLTAMLADITSDPTEIRVVTEPTVIGLSIYSDAAGPPIVLGAADLPVPCYECGYTITVLNGDVVHFHATAQYDTGAWRDVTDEVTWRSSDATIMGINGHGVATAAQAGDVAIDAVLGDVTSGAVTIHIVNTATLQNLYVYQEGGDHVVARGTQLFFHATGYYDVGFTREVTTEATWRSSDDAVGGFDTPGVFTGRAAGTVQVWAELNGQQSIPPVQIEVFETSELDYCDPANVNRGVWADDFNRVVLESDCAAYTEPGVAALRFTVTETQAHGGIFNPCLDLYAYQGGARVRTIRQEGCGDPFVPVASPDRGEAVLRYQLRAFWDLKDDGGSAVPDGIYTIYGRFYLYYDPVVSIDVAVSASGAPVPTRTPTPTGHPARSVTPTPCECGETPTATPPPHVCTPPPCRDDEVLYCPADCSGRCGFICVTLTPPAPPPTIVPPTPAGACFIGSTTCTGMPLLTSQERCCATISADGQALPISWCPSAQLDPSTGQCATCSDPCTGLPTPTPTSIPAPQATPVVEGACYIGSATCTGRFIATAQRQCCALFQFGALPEVLSWCPADQLDAATGQCAACASTPCEEIPLPAPG